MAKCRTVANTTKSEKRKYRTSFRIVGVKTFHNNVTCTLLENFCLPLLSSKDHSSLLTQRGGISEVLLNQLLQLLIGIHCLLSHSELLLIGNLNPVYSYIVFFTLYLSLGDVESTHMKELHSETIQKIEKFIRLFIYPNGEKPSKKDEENENHLRVHPHLKSLAGN